MIHRALIVVGIVAVLLGFTVGPASATWSVVGVDPETGEVGVAVASCVGFEVTVVPVLVPGVGAGASQADISAPSGDSMAEALAAGSSAEEVIDAVVASDAAPETRQFGVVVLDDGGAGWTGSDTLDVALDRRSEDGTVAVQGNILVSQDVVDAAIAAFEDTEGVLADRVLAGLVAGADQGGDSRCADQTATAAALLVARPDDEIYAFTDAASLGVDPQVEAVPSVFISILVEKGGERAPDRLAQAWNDADQASSSVVIRQIDAGAETAKSRATTVVLVLLGALVVGGALVVWLILGSVRRAKNA
jgi:uncharacterized Ntn-hydrolase superfamily protein